METVAIIFEFVLAAFFMAAPMAFKISKHWAKFIFFLCGVLVLCFGGWQIYKERQPSCTFLRTLGDSSNISIIGGSMSGCEVLEDQGKNTKLKMENVPVTK
jgi:hypothetical protein